MSGAPIETFEPDAATNSRWRRWISSLGKPAVDVISYIGAMWLLLVNTSRWVWRSVALRQVRFGRPALYAQMVRVGVRAIGVITLVSGCIGFILALQMAPTLEDFGQISKVANIIAIAVVRELGPLIGAIVLVGFAGASIAAELGTMVVGEEIEALEAHALNPVRFLVVPRLIATTVCTVVLCIMANLIAIGAGWLISWTMLGIEPMIYYRNTVEQLDVMDFVTGLWKAGVFGLIMGLIACHNGLSVTGGAAGVGRATTNTVVHSIIAIIFTDLIFTAIFFRLGWH